MPPIPTSDPLKNKGKWWGLRDKKFLPENRGPAPWIKEGFCCSQCSLSGISELPHLRDCWLSAFFALQISVSAAAILSFFPIVIYWRAGGDGENPSLWFLSLHMRGTTRGRDRRTLLGWNTLWITAEVMQTKSRILRILNALSSFAIRIKTLCFYF